MKNETTEAKAATYEEEVRDMRGVVDAQPPVDNHQEVLVTLGRADGEATCKVGGRPLVFVEGDGGAGEGNVGKQACVEGQ